MDDKQADATSNESPATGLTRRSVLVSGAAAALAATLKKTQRHGTADEERPVATLVLAAALLEEPSEAAFRTRVEGFGPAGVGAVQSVFRATRHASRTRERATTKKSSSAVVNLVLYVVDLDDASARRSVLEGAAAESRRGTPSLCLGASACGGEGFGSELSCPFFVWHPSESAASRRLRSPRPSAAGLAQGLSALVDSMFVPGVAVSTEDVMELFGPPQTRGHFASAVAEGEGRAVRAAGRLSRCFSCQEELGRATRLLLSFNCPPDARSEEINQALTVLHQEVHPEADILFSSLVDDDARGLTITALASGPYETSPVVTVA